MDELNEIKLKIKKLERVLNTRVSEKLKENFKRHLDILARNLQFLETNYFFEKLSKKELESIDLIINELFDDNNSLNNERMRLPNGNWPFDRAKCYVSFIEEHWIIRVQIGRYENIGLPTEPPSEVGAFSFKEFFLKYKNDKSTFIKIKLDKYPELPDQYNWKMVLEKNIPGINFNLFD